MIMIIKEYEKTYVQQIQNDYFYRNIGNVFAMLIQLLGNQNVKCARYMKIPIRWSNNPYS